MAHHSPRSYPFSFFLFFFNSQIWPWEQYYIRVLEMDVAYLIKRSAMIWVTAWSNHVMRTHPEQTIHITWMWLLWNFKRSQKFRKNREKKKIREQKKSGVTLSKNEKSGSVIRARSDSWRYVLLWNITAILYSPAPTMSEKSKKNL